MSLRSFLRLTLALCCERGGHVCFSTNQQTTSGPKTLPIFCFIKNQSSSCQMELAWPCCWFSSLPPCLHKQHVIKTEILTCRQSFTQTTQHIPTFFIKLRGMWEIRICIQRGDKTVLKWCSSQFIYVNTNNLQGVIFKTIYR